MYTLTTINKERTLTGETLEDLRRQLIDYHEDNRRDPQYGDYQDQFEAVYPLDESELDEDKVPTEPRPLTADILEGLACHVWDVSVVNLREEDGTTINNLAETLHYMLDMDEDAAEDVLRTYITQIEELEDRDIDEDAISEADADFLIGAVKSARAAGDLGELQLADVEEAAFAYQHAADTAEALRQERDKAIRAAIAAGASKATVARAAGVSPQAISKMAQR